MSKLTLESIRTYLKKVGYNKADTLSDGTAVYLYNLLKSRYE